MARKKVPLAVSEYFRQLAAKTASKAGKIGGKRSLETMTAEERTERARKAAAASAKVRRRKALQKK